MLRKQRTAVAIAASVITLACGGGIAYAATCPGMGGTSGTTPTTTTTGTTTTVIGISTKAFDNLGKSIGYLSDELRSGRFPARAAGSRSSSVAYRQRDRHPAQRRRDHGIDVGNGHSHGAAMDRRISRQSTASHGKPRGLAALLTTVHRIAWLRTRPLAVTQLSGD